MFLVSPVIAWRLSLRADSMGSGQRQAGLTTYIPVHFEVRGVLTKTSDLGLAVTLGLRLMEQQCSNNSPSLSSSRC